MFFDYNEVNTLTAQLRENDDLRFVSDRLLESASLLIKSSSVGDTSVIYPLLNLARLSDGRYLEDTYFTYEITQRFNEIWGNKEVPYTDIIIVLLKCYEGRSISGVDGVVRLLNELVGRKHGYEVIGQTIMSAYIHYRTEDFETHFVKANLDLVNAVHNIMLKGFQSNESLSDEKVQITLMIKTLQHTLKYSINKD